MKRKIFISLLVAAMGVIVLSGCEKSDTCECNMPNKGMKICGFINDTLLPNDIKGSCKQLYYILYEEGGIEKKALIKYSIKLPSDVVGAEKPIQINSIVRFLSNDEYAYGTNCGFDNYIDNIYCINIKK
ncbi:MAG: hypothetical protein J6T48_06820 [Bacteroidales bacterium]|nr:hypothetical protein [Bacteroidales bacterium]